MSSLSIVVKKYDDDMNFYVTERIQFAGINHETNKIILQLYNGRFKEGGHILCAGLIIHSTKMSCCFQNIFHEYI